MASYPVIRPLDLMRTVNGMLLPNQINMLESNTVSSGWTSALTTTYYYLGSYLPSGWNKPIPAKAASASTSVFNVCYGINPRCLSGGLYSNSCIPMSADSGSYTYAAIPYYKSVEIRVYEDLTGSANFEYLYFRYNGTDYTGLTWSSISGSWTGQLGMNLQSISAYTEHEFVIHCGGMNTSRRIHYSDNVVSPGAWTYIGKYSSLDIQPGINVANKSWIVSGVTRQYPFEGDPGYKTGYTMNFVEYFHRLRSVAIAVGYSSTPSSSNASSSTYAPTYSYSSVCSRYSCTCDCDYQECIDYTI